MKQEREKIVKIMIEFFKAVLLMPKPWVAWPALLMAVNMVLPIFFIGALEARWYWSR